ncbi:MAG: hypothetical protein LBS34_01520 [Rickettsiales bacterium]|jgi:transposase-like protein|nr:hypothetical protein [Rickettsiales bacterium]
MPINHKELIIRDRDNNPSIYKTFKFLSKDDMESISEAINIECSHCGSKNYKKYGKSNNNKQKYHCKDCGKKFIVNPNQFFTDMLRSIAVYIHINNCGLRRIGNILGVSFQLIAYWLYKASIKLDNEIKKQKHKNGSISTIVKIHLKKE